MNGAPVSVCDLLEPESVEEVRAAVADALAAGTPLEVCGNGSKRGIGFPAGSWPRLSTSRLSGVSLYEPEELVMRAAPGTPMERIRMQLEQHGQMLAFEPPDFGPLLGGAPGRATIGGVIAGNISGSRRIRSGAARDHFLGVEAVSGRAEAFRSGGRVVKNVTGYDLCKLMCGSWGTLGIMTELAIKVLPAPERTRTVLVSCSDAASAVRAMTAALSSPHDVSAAAWLPANIAVRSGVSLVASARASLTALRLEGFGASAEARCRSLRDELGSFGDVEELHTANSKVFWRETGEAAYFAGDREAEIWRISVPPAAAPAFYERMCGELPAEGWLDWGGGLIWISVAEAAGERVVRGEAARRGGHATLLRAGAARRGAVGAFQPEPAPVARLTRNVKDAFDPKRILNPGRMYEGV